MVFILCGDYSLSADLLNMAYLVAIIAPFASVGAVHSTVGGQFVSATCARFVRFIGSVFRSPLESFQSNGFRVIVRSFGS